MQKRYKRQLQQLNFETKQILDDLDSIEDPSLQKNARVWSVIQVLGHLELSEAGTLKYMQKKILAGEKMKRASFIHKLRMRLVNLLLSTWFRWKAPLFIADPPNNYSLAEISDRWKNTRGQLEKYVEEYPEELSNRLVFRHPMAGRQALGEAISSIVYHQRHHVHQIKRIRKELKI